MRRTLVAANRSATLLLCLALGLAVTGCGIRWNADVAVVGMRIAEVDVFETTAVFTVRIENLEPEALLLDGATFEIFVEGTRVGRGLVSERLEVGRISSVALEVPVHISNIRAATELRDIIESRRFHYRVNSTLFVVRGSRTREARVSREGEVDLTGGPQ